jgi:hypothetical protein
MATSPTHKRRLTDAYAFPGFRPQQTIRGIFGDPKACIVDLVRRSKKQPAAAAGAFIPAGTTGAYEGFATCRAATGVSTWNSRFGGFSARVAAP